MTREAIFNTVRDVLLALVKNRNEPIEIRPQTSLIRDLGLTSLTMVDLTLALEEAFELDEFPMQAWVDQELLRGEQGFGVASLVESCAVLVAR